MARNTLHRLITRAPFAPQVDLAGKRVIVTGAAQGSIGGETARILASGGADVVVTTRSDAAETARQLTESVAEVEGHGLIDGHALDLGDEGSVREFAGWYLAQHGDRLDVLINNAGVHLDLLSEWKEPHRLADGQEIHWRINYLGTMHLTHLLLPLLCTAGERTGDARIVNVVSRLHERGNNAGLLDPPARYSSWVAYGLSKLALVHATKEIERRYGDGKGVHASCLHPGAVFTDIASKGLAGHPRITRVRGALKPVEELFLLTPEEGAQTSVFCATQPLIEGGGYYVRCRRAEPAPDAADAETSARLWEWTQEWIRRRP